MKIRYNKKLPEQGSALIITFTFGIILLVVLASYLMLLSGQKNLVTRSQTWNGSLTIAEAGVEEALAQVNQSNSVSLFTTNLAQPAVTNFSNNGWGGGSVPVFGPMTRSLQAGSYSVSISNQMASGTVCPTIYATGYATVPIVGTTIHRQIKVTTSPQPLFNVGMGAVTSINFNGNGVATDSFNSGLTNLSTLGQYDPTKTSTNGDVASQEGLVDIGNHTIDGNLYLGPGATYDNSGTVDGNVDYNYNVDFPDVTLPTGAANWTTATTTSTQVGYVKNNGSVGTNTITAYDFTTSGNYIVNQDKPVVVEAGVTVNLDVTSTTWSGSGMYLNGGYLNSGTAVIYFNGPSSVSIAGNTAVNPTSRPENLWYFGLPSMTSITFSGTSSFVGVIYGPEVSLTLNGGGNGFGVMGSVIVNNVTMNGHYDFHYDESLAHYGPSRGYIATSWVEQ